MSEGPESGRGPEGTPGLEGMGSLRRTHACGAVDATQVGREVVVAGWVHRRRDHGGVIFVDLRDREGLVQVVFKPEVARAAHERVSHVRSEWVVLVRGVVEHRSPETVNPKLATGAIEITARDLRILNSATPPPFA
ncbi:MAG TPA: OB-fold nucleic acid binding domain-containing protein, partial [Myxococcota bacterium]|nr:OB-fold nucleic acid binding domain-containing protein [Myxococcota bacterium]